MKNGIFITATDTNVGKTYVSAHLAGALSKLNKKIAYFKPFQSGVEEGVLSDVETVQKIAPNVIVKNSYITQTPATPAISAEIDGIEISLKKVVDDYNELSKNCDFTIVEGSGGMMVPVYHNLLMKDVITALNLPVIVVARPDLGTINHTLLTISALKNMGAKILGVIISNYPKNTIDPAILTAKKYIEEFSGVQVLATLYNEMPAKFDRECLELVLN